MSDEPQRILIAEDNAALASVVRFNLERAGFQVTVAANGRIAWEAAQRERFDLVITDYQMPEMDGGELARLLRDDENYVQTPIILLTAKGLEIELSCLREALDITATFAKPFSPREVVDSVQAQLAETGQNEMKQNV